MFIAPDDLIFAPDGLIFAPDGLIFAPVGARPSGRSIFSSCSWQLL
jgi:hypothetical protein